MNDHYAYLVGALIYDAAWVACYFWCKSYRAQMIWGSLVSAPFALTSILFIPQYWSPPSLFNLDARFKVGIEDFLWAGAVGGIASVIGEAFLKERFAARRGQKRQRHFAPFVVMGVLFLILEFWHPGQTMYNMIFALLVGALVVIIIRPDLTLLMLVGSGLFTALYWVLFLYFLAFFPEFISQYYNVSNLLGISIRGVPIEELLFAAAGGAVWSVAYEYIQGYRLAPNKRFSLVEVQGP
jgi:hypothetical protein